MGRLLCVSAAVAVVEFLVVPDPAGMDPTLFDNVGTMLNVFVGLLLSFFLTANVNRWIQVVNGFLGLFNSTRNLQLILQAFGTKRESADRVLRYCVLSARLITFDMQVHVMPKDVRADAKAGMWEELSKRENPYSKLLPEEREQLEKVDDASGLMWTWVMSMLGRMSQDGELPPFAAGTFGTVLTAAAAAKKGMDALRDTICVQMPFVYVHTVATIVQLNNLLAATSLGLTIGSVAAASLARYNSVLHIFSNDITHAHRPLIEDIQEVLVQLFRCFVAPVLYQAFCSEDGAIPAERLIQRLEKDLQENADRAESPPLWKPPQIKSPA